jgi:hypothetical protein
VGRTTSFPANPDGLSWETGWGIVKAAGAERERTNNIHAAANRFPDLF